MKPIAASVDRTRQRIDGYQQVHAQRKTRLQSEEARYTTILHHARKQLGLTINEYCFADTVEKLSSGRSMVPGWCYASKEHLADTLGFTRRGVTKMIKSLKDQGILEGQEGTGYLRTTDLWHESVVVLKERVFGR